jgi:hypothetical protein
MFADAFWTFAMALNVYLTFFRRFNAKQLRSLEWKYILFCYGTPFILAFTLLFVRSESRGKVYGSAVVCSHPILLLPVIPCRLTFLVVVLGEAGMGCSPRRRLLWTSLAGHLSHLRDLPLRLESGASMASRAIEVCPTSPQ